MNNETEVWLSITCTLYEEGCVTAKTTNSGNSIFWERATEHECQKQFKEDE